MDQTSDLIGSSPRRKEDRRLLVGAGRYLDDMTREGLLHLGVVRSPHGHARIRSIDMRDARTLPSVVAAWSAADLPEAARPILAGSEGAHKGRPFAARVLAGDVVRYVGECVAVVVADEPYRLADAIERVAVDYEPLPALVTAEEALASETRLHADWPDNVAVVARGIIGDAEQGDSPTPTSTARCDFTALPLIPSAFAVMLRQVRPPVISSFAGGAPPSTPDTSNAWTSRSWFAYLTLFLLQLKVVWGVWRYLET